MTKFTLTSRFTGRVNSLYLPGPAKKIQAWLDQPEDQRKLTTDVFPEFNPEQIDFLDFGVLPDEWPLLRNELSTLQIEDLMEGEK